MIKMEIDMQISNLAAWDRIVRGIAGVVLISLFAAGVITGTLGIILTILGAVLLITGVVGFCPLYKLFNIRTNKPVPVPVRKH
jgi:hypothetical protein